MVFCVNDGAVMKAWKKDMGLEGSDMIEFLADTHADLTEALGLTLTGDGKPYPKGDGPNKALGFHTKRCKRSAMYVVDGQIKAMPIADAPAVLFFRRYAFSFLLRRWPSPRRPTTLPATTARRSPASRTCSSSSPRCRSSRVEAADQRAPRARAAHPLAT